MEDARGEYRRRLRDRIRELEAAMRSVSSAAAGSADEVRRIAHQLHGSGATYGFPRISEAAAAAERASPPDLAAAAAGLLTVLHDVADGTDPGGPTPPPPTHPPDAGAGPLVLIVDDDPDITRLLAAVLAAPGRRIAVAASAGEARGILAGADVALVLLDLFLPDEDGRLLLSDIRRRPDTSTLPVFVLSARFGGAIKTECYQLGADGYFEKPVDPALLLAAVNSRLDRDAVPTAPAPAPAPIPAPVAAPGRRGAGVVLLAEDDELIAAVVRHRLGREGFDVRRYADGNAALAAAHDLRADLAILDVKMPGMDGFELLGRLREVPAWADVPVLILTSLGGERDLVRAFDLGAADYVLKPFSPAELVARVRRLLPD